MNAHKNTEISACMQHQGSCEELLIELRLVASVKCVAMLMRWNGEIPFCSRDGGLDSGWLGIGDEGDAVGC